MKRLLLPLMVFILIGSPVATAQDAISDEAWREDIEALAAGILRLHPDPFRSTSAADFDASLQNLLNDVPNLSDAEIFVRMMRLVAGLQDGHSWMWSMTPDGYALQFYPLIFYYFEDGVYVVDASPDYADFIGARLVSVGGMDAESAFDILRLSASADNEWSQRHTTARQLNVSNILQGAGITQDEPDYVLSLPNGDTVTLNPDTLDFDALTALFPSWGLFYRELLPYRAGLAYLDRRDEEFWFQYREDNRALYIVYNMATRRTASGFSMAALVEEIESHIDGGSIDRVIIDLRNNPGGDEATSRPLSNLLQNHEFFDEDGRLFVLTGRHTFSAAVVFSLRLEAETSVVFIGEPPGGSPLMFENNRDVNIPNTGLTVQIATRARRDVPPEDTRRSIEPHIYIPALADKYFSGNDPVLQAALDYAP